MDVEASDAGATSDDAVAPPITNGTVDGSGSPEAPAAPEAAASSQVAAISEASALATAEVATATTDSICNCCFAATARKQRIKGREGFATCLLVFSNLVEAMIEARLRDGSTVLVDKVLTHVKLDII
jgi:hypothetical protein